MATPQDFTESTDAAPGDAAEVDLWWEGCASRTLLPLFTLCGILSVAIFLTARFAWSENPSNPQLVGRLTMYPVVAIWLAALGRWAYQMAAVNYRLTTRHLFRDRGFGHPGQPGTPLTRIVNVQVEQRTWERWVGVGRIRVQTDDGGVLILAGVRNPEQAAGKIRQQMERVRSSGAGRPD